MAAAGPSPRAAQSPNQSHGGPRRRRKRPATALAHFHVLQRACAARRTSRRRRGRDVDCTGRGDATAATSIAWVAATPRPRRRSTSAELPSRPGARRLVGPRAPQGVGAPSALPRQPRRGRGRGVAEIRRDLRRATRQSGTRFAPAFETTPPPHRRRKSRREWGPCSGLQLVGDGSRRRRGGARRGNFRGGGSRRRAKDPAQHDLSPPRASALTPRRAPPPPRWRARPSGRSP